MPVLLSIVATSGVALSGRHTTADREEGQAVSVRQTGGTYAVTARFEVPQSPDRVLTVLSDYASLPRFIPGLRSSVIVERSAGRTLIEQVAVPRLVMFSKTVYLLLEVTEEEGGLRFVDRSGRSFKRYEGGWQTVRLGGGTRVTYELIAAPSFDVPKVVLTRILNRDTARTISALRRELAARDDR